MFWGTKPDVNSRVALSVSGVGLKPRDDVPSDVDSRGLSNSHCPSPHPARRRHLVPVGLVEELVAGLALGVASGSQRYTKSARPSAEARVKVELCTASSFATIGQRRSGRVAQGPHALSLAGPRSCKIAAVRLWLS